MKTIVFTLVLSCISFFGSAQNVLFSFVDQDEFDVSESVFFEAKSLSDLHRFYKDEWVAKYVSTKLVYEIDGKVKEAKGTSHELSSAQKELLANVEAGGTIELIVDYIPDNSLSHNDVKKMDFKFYVNPCTIPEIKIGDTAFKKYINERLLNHISEAQEAKLKFSVVELEISNEGQVSKVNLVEKTGDDKLDSLLVKVIEDMPLWSPATSASGKTLAYEMKFYMTNVKNSCMINTIVSRK